MQINPIFLNLLVTFSSLIVSAQTIRCPEGFVEVPTGRDSNFCVMSHPAKAWMDFNGNGVIDSGEINSSGHPREVSASFYEEPTMGGPFSWITFSEGYSAKTDIFVKNHNPVSTAVGKPWTHVSYEQAEKLCSNLNLNNKDGNTRFELISNNDWFVIASNIENVSANWSSGSVGSGCIKQGNTGFATECSYDAGGIVGGEDDRSAHVLSNGKKIFHFTGNASHHVSIGRYTWPMKYIDPQPAVFSESKAFKSSKNYPESMCHEKNNYCGLGSHSSGPKRHFPEYSPIQITRGGYHWKSTPWNSDRQREQMLQSKRRTEIYKNYPGIFSVREMTRNDLYSSNLTTFRCVLKLKSADANATRKDYQ